MTINCLSEGNDFWGTVRGYGSDGGQFRKMKEAVRTGRPILPQCAPVVHCVRKTRNKAFDQPSSSERSYGRVTRQ
jgi:hypothetical protein